MPRRGVQSTTHQVWAQNAPSDIETIGLTYNARGLNLGFFSKRVGKLYDDVGDIHEGVAIDPFDITKIFLNYTVGGASLDELKRLLP